jgi:hypothetical protein
LGGGGHLMGKLIFGGALLFAHAVVTWLSPPGDSPAPPLSKRNIYPRNIAPMGRIPYRNIAPFRIFAPHICDVVYSNNFVILSSY